MLGAWLALLPLSPAHAMTLEERRQLDLNDYRVNDPDAGFFDVGKRMTLLSQTRDPILIQQADQVRLGPSCRQYLATPPLAERIRLPAYYPDHNAWRLAAEPLFRFEDSVSMLAGSFTVTADPYYADCLVSMLDQWARADALYDFYYNARNRQAWYGIESMLFAAGLSYSIVRPYVQHRPEALSRIDHWLNRVARHHMAIPGEQASCCNNHFYRRALYASIIGVLTKDDELFRFGVSAIYSALHDLTTEGALPLEIARGRRASHYQNYALLYLITNMQIISRQGYPIFDLVVDGHHIGDAVDFAMDVIDDPSALGELAPHEQYLGFLEDPQYFAWMEIYQNHVHSPRIDAFLDGRRPIYNRSNGGYVSLYFMQPSSAPFRQQQRQARRHPPASSAEVSS